MTNAFPLLYLKSFSDSALTGVVMRRRAKTIIFILLALGLLVVFFAAGSSWLFADRFSRLETESMQTEVRRAN